MHITFVLPGNNFVPSGGVKIVYEYANRLILKGYKVNIVHTANSDINPSLINKFKFFIQYIKCFIKKRYSARNWFDVDHRINIFWVPSLHQNFIPSADAVIATAWKTSEWVVNYPECKGRKFYLIQHKETWNGPEDRV